MYDSLLPDSGYELHIWHPPCDKIQFSHEDYFVYVQIILDVLDFLFVSYVLFCLCSFALLLDAGFVVLYSFFFCFFAGERKEGIRC